MKVLVVDASNAGRDAFAGALRGTRHSVEVLGALDSAIRRVPEIQPDLIAFAAPSTALAVDFARRSRPRNRGAAPYLLLLTHSLAPEHLDAVFAAGIDDFIRLPAHPDEARARVEAAGRPRQRRSAEGRTTLAFAGSIEPERILGLSSWRSLPTTIATEIAGMLSAPTSVMPIAAAASKGTLIARVVCAIPSESLEVSFQIGASQRHLDAVGLALLGVTPDDAMRADVLREIANGAAGAFKRAALPDGLSFTLGLPEIEPYDAAQWVEAPTSRLWGVSSTEPAAQIVCRANVRAVKGTRVRASELREGMVLASDLLAESGALVAAGGTRITASNAERVAKFLGPKHWIDIAGAA